MRRIERAVSAGVVRSTLPLNELSFALMFGKSGGESSFANCLRVIRRWLSQVPSTGRVASRFVSARGVSSRILAG